jgi:hypothetical protein
MLDQLTTEVINPLQTYLRPLMPKDMIQYRFTHNSPLQFKNWFRLCLHVRHHGELISENTANIIPMDTESIPNSNSNCNWLDSIFVQMQKSANQYVKEHKLIKQITNKKRSRASRRMEAMSEESRIHAISKALPIHDSAGADASATTVRVIRIHSSSTNQPNSLPTVTNTTTIVIRSPHRPNNNNNNNNNMDIIATNEDDQQIIPSSAVKPTVRPAFSTLSKTHAQRLAALYIFASNDSEFKRLLAHEACRWDAEIQSTFPEVFATSNEIKKRIKSQLIWFIGVKKLITGDDLNQMLRSLSTVVDALQMDLNQILVNYIKSIAIDEKENTHIDRESVATILKNMIDYLTTHQISIQCTCGMDVYSKFIDLCAKGFQFVTEVIIGGPKPTLPDDEKQNEQKMDLIYNTPTRNRNRQQQQPTNVFNAAMEVESQPSSLIEDE